MKAPAILTLGAVALLASGCSQLFGGLRHDMNDQQGQSAPATYGGQWPEHGWLDDDMSVSGNYTNDANGQYDAVGHSERNPASAGYGNQGAASSSWVTPDDVTANQRDSYRGITGNGAPSFASAPNLVPQTRRLYKNGTRATADDFIDDTPNEGSLWASNGQTNYYFTKNQVLGVGDIISVKVDPALLKDVGAEIERTLTADEKDAEIAAAQSRMNSRAPASAGGAAGAPAAAGGPAPASVSPSAPTATEKDIDVTQSIDMKAGDTIMAEIVERYPNGNYKIRGSKKIIYSNGTPRMLTLVAVAPNASIAQDNTIPSGKLYEYRLEAFR